MRSRAKAGPLQDAARGEPLPLVARELDVTRQDSIDRPVAATRELDGTIDVLVNNAGIGGAHSQTLAGPGAPSNPMPQPFPSQLMIGFVATYAGGELKVDADELEDARCHRAPDPHGSPRGERAQRGAARGPCLPG